MLIEALEDRRLMSGSVAADLSCGGMLFIHGTDRADTIDVVEQGGLVTVVANGDADHPVFFGSAKFIVIDAGAGNDQVSYFGDSLNSVVYLSDGNDYLQVGMTGSAHSLVLGGRGDDLVIASGNVTVWGGPGSDIVIQA